MKYKTLYLLFILIVKCRLALDPTPQSSPSIEKSKSDKVFLNEYQPQYPYLELQGVKYKIKEAWAEHPHLERNEGHIPINGYDFVMTFHKNPNDTINFKTYTKDLSLGNSKIWFFIHEDEFLRDTLVLYYKNSLNSSEQKKFLLFKVK